MIHLTFMLVLVVHIIAFASGTWHLPTCQFSLFLSSPVKFSLHPNLLFPKHGHRCPLLFNLYVYREFYVDCLCETQMPSFLQPLCQWEFFVDNLLYKMSRRCQKVHGPLKCLLNWSFSHMDQGHVNNNNVSLKCCVVRTTSLLVAAPRPQSSASVG